MSVAMMLEKKGDKIITARTDDTIEVVAGVLAKHRIGAVVVLDGSGKMAGIASERDIIRQLAQEGATALTQSVSSCMTREVISCSREDTVNEAMAAMTNGRFRHMPVLDNGDLIGLISIGDVVSRKISEAEREKEDMQRYIAEGHA